MSRRGSLVFAPGVFAFAAAALGSLALFAFAIGLMVLYLACVAMLAVAARRLEVTRTLDRREVQEGQPFTITFATKGLRWLPVTVEALGDDGAWHPATQPLKCVIDRPGAHVLDASPLRLCDDLGLFTRTVGRGHPESVLVLPEPALAPEGLRRVGARVASDPEPDGLRPYTPGTPISRIHWISAARGGELQERHFVTGRDRLPLVVVDATNASGAALDQLGRSAAGLVLAFARSGGCRVLLPGDRVATIVPDISAWPSVHRRLAALEPGAGAAHIDEHDAVIVRGVEVQEERGALPPGVVALEEWAA